MGKDAENLLKATSNYETVTGKTTGDSPCNQDTRLGEIANEFNTLKTLLAHCYSANDPFSRLKYVSEQRNIVFATKIFAKILLNLLGNIFAC